MSGLIFCNIGWMDQYKGIVGKTDRIVGGGKWIDEHRAGGEVCNFLPCEDGYVYGHVETSRSNRETGEWIDRDIDINKLGASRDDDYIEGVDVVWTAKNPLEGGRHIVGWYRDATLFRARQLFPRAPSPQHRRDKIKNFRVRTGVGNEFLINQDKRDVQLEAGQKGWMGHTPWWFGAAKTSPKAVAVFLDNVRVLIENGTAVLARATVDAGGVVPLEYDSVRRLVRDRQPAFRKAVLQAYSRTCAITGCTVEQSLEATHINRYADSGDNSLSNGLLLRADLHRLMDAGLLTFRWHDGKLWPLMHFSIRGSEYGDLETSSVRLPPERSQWPSKKVVVQQASGAKGVLGKVKALAA